MNATLRARPGGMAAQDGRENVRNTWEARLERWCAPRPAGPAAPRRENKRERRVRRGALTLPARATRLRVLPRVLPRGVPFGAPKRPFPLLYPSGCALLFSFARRVLRRRRR